MSSTPKYRLPASAIEADREALLALQELTDYRPVNPEHTVEALKAREQALRQSEEEEVRTQKRLTTVRDEVVDAGWGFHDAIMGAKAQVSAQYGNNSNAIQSLGLKKRSDRKRTQRRASSSPKGD
ncbi:hypothetical protein SE17_26770 [Kouleothrix aurantiaca]|uniref:Uncharacterized protein n=1 Tax=Kouleothrix aurantiaca TaxID=186479 RepID=A0A0P9CWI6_9CHLR|nr:hypothetical protein SE17_26770 [Kouleothrix aurantiaca]